MLVGTYGKFAYISFIAGYSGIPLYLIMFAGYAILHKTKGILAESIDLYTGKQDIDDEEAKFL